MCHFGTHSGRIREDPGGQHHSTKLPREWEVWRHWQKWAESVTPGVFHFSPNKIWLDAIIALKIWALILSDTGGDQLKHSTCSFETFLVILVLVFCVICKSRQNKRICNYIKCKCDNLLEKCTENTSKYGTLKFTQYNRRLKTEKHLVNVGVVPEYPDIKTLLAHSPTSLTSGQHMLLVKSNFFLKMLICCVWHIACVSCTCCMGFVQLVNVLFQPERCSLPFCCCLADQCRSCVWLEWRILKHHFIPDVFLFQINLEKNGHHNIQIVFFPLSNKQSKAKCVHFPMM